MTAAACPRCGNVLAAYAPGGLCAGCLLAASAETLMSGSTDDLATMTSAAASRIPRSDGLALQPDTVWPPQVLGLLVSAAGMIAGSLLPHFVGRPTPAPEPHEQRPHHAAAQTHHVPAHAPRHEPNR